MIVTVSPEVGTSPTPARLELTPQFFTPAGAAFVAHLAVQAADGRQLAVYRLEASGKTGQLTLREAKPVQAAVDRTDSPAPAVSPATGAA